MVSCMVVTGYMFITGVIIEKELREQLEILHARVERHKEKTLNEAILGVN